MVESGLENMPTAIEEFIGPWRFLSNFWSCYILFDGLEYPSVENAYQAAKCAKGADRLRFQNIKASEAKKLGRVIAIREGWDGMKLDIMHRLVLQKFREPSLKDKLIATGDVVLQEGNWWGDTFWGTVNGVGQNHLGKILMSVREEVK